MRHTHTIVGLTGESEIHDRDNDGEISIELHDGSNAVSLLLPSNDADAQLVTDLLQAAIENAASRVGVREHRRFIEAPDEEILETVR